MAAGDPFLMVLWTRQGGKSLCLALRALWRAYGGRERLVLIVSGGGEAGARRLMGEARRLASRSAVLRGSIADEQANVLTLSNGSVIRAVAASESAIRGWSADELLLDEAQLIPDDLALGAALPTVAAKPGARVVATGTASVASGWFYDLCRRGEAGDEGVRLSLRVSELVGGGDAMPWQSPTLMRSLEKAMGPLRADAELRCRWSRGAVAFVSRAVLDRVTADFAGDRWKAALSRSYLLSGFPMSTGPVGFGRGTLGVRPACSTPLGGRWGRLGGAGRGFGLESATARWPSAHGRSTSLALYGQLWPVCPARQ